MIVAGKLTADAPLAPLVWFKSGGTAQWQQSNQVVDGARVVVSSGTLDLAGKTFTLTKPRVVIGRSGTDIELDDPEVSRWHCSIEVKDKVIRLRDLDSTNGLFFEDEKIRAAELQQVVVHDR